MKLDRDRFYLFWSAAIVLCVILALFALFFSACQKTEEPAETGLPVETEDVAATLPPAATESPAPAETEQPAATESPAPTEPPQSPVRLGETPDAGREYLDQIIFLGDSTTYGIGVYYGLGYTELCPRTQVWTPASGTLTLSYYNIATVVYPETGEELPVADAVARAKPAYLVVTLGVNGISFMDETWFIRDYISLVQMIQAASPDTKIILNSIYPVAASYRYTGDINNDKINAANRWIERIAEQTGCRFLYSFESLVGADGYLPESLQNGDGLHLTGEAFTTVMQYIRTHAYR
jgi:lysophospholipase L1-like esterase